MIVPTPAVLFARRDAWAKAIAAADAYATEFAGGTSSRTTAGMVVLSVRDRIIAAARRDGVTFDAEAASPIETTP